MSSDCSQESTDCSAGGLPQRIVERFGDYRWLAIVILLVAANASAAEVDARLSSGQAYVDDSITLQISIQNAGHFKPPEIPTVDGIQIEPAGTPQRSSQTTILNGRVSRRESVVLQYEVTPQRTGTFEIPPMEVSVDGRTIKTSPLEFVASVSETGDLLFVEIEGKQDKVYVGEPLELVLKIGVQPYREPELDFTLSEADMWGTLSPRSAWGPFQKRRDDMTERRRRPGGEPVVRKTDDGESNRFFVYEIETTFYPNKPGKIDAGDVRIVVDYPVELREGRRRSMMDDFFGGGFGPTLSIAQSRPISAMASVDATQILPLPTEGRPTTFQGAVGNYTLQAKTDSKEVIAGDPITLQIAVSGDGPLDNLQSPPLDSLQESFRFDGQPLAGFIQDGVKYFTTTIRPKNETVQEIPAISMSFFDPAKETFQTVSSDPISLDVLPAEKLAMDAIVGTTSVEDAKTGSAISVDPSALSWSPTNWLLGNTNGISVLKIQQPASLKGLACWLFGIPAGLFLIVMGVQGRTDILALASWVRSAKQRAERQLSNTTSPVEIPPILSNYVSSAFTSRHKPLGRDWQSSLGALRSNGHSGLAADLEALASRCKIEGSDHDSTTLRVQEAEQWLELADADRKASSNRFLRLQRSVRPAIDTPITGIILVALVSMMAATEAQASNGVVLLSTEQQETLLREADEIYQNASNLDVEQANEAFQIAAMKYQQVIESGVQNAGLYRNLANASIRSGQLGQAIANYRLAESYEPASLANQLSLLIAQIRAGVPLRQWHAPLLCLLIGTVFSIAGWFFLSRGVLRQHRTTGLLGLAALLISLYCLTVTLRQTHDPASGHVIAVVVAENIDVRTGDGHEFDVVARLENVEGHCVDVQQQRGDWFQINAADAVAGWVPVSSLQIVSSFRTTSPIGGTHRGD